MTRTWALLAVLAVVVPTFLTASAQNNCDAISIASADNPQPPTGEKDKKKQKDKGNNAGRTVPLARVICEVEQALDDYQDEVTTPLKPASDMLPGLATADMDFKTVVDTKGGISFSFLLFKFGVTHDNQATNDLDFIYEPKSRHRTGNAHGFQKVEPFQPKLVETIKAAARAIQDQRSAVQTSKDPLVLKQFSVTLAFSVTWDGSAGATGPIELVTIGGTYERSRNDVQTVKLTFADPDKPK
jgi:hypothetical protein